MTKRASATFKRGGAQPQRDTDTLADLPEVGVGITFSSALIDTLLQHDDLVDVIEIEPQSLWSEHPSSSPRYRSKAEIDDMIEALPFRKLVHSIGLPVGGSLDHDVDQVALLGRTIDRLDSPWFSEHLSFNRSADGATGFFLPPRQTLAGVEQCAASIRRLRQSIGRPIAIETGVNYLATRADEIADGTFVSLVAEAADCGILLDLHNIYTNERNGRQRVDEFVDQLDRNRVIEVHMAGGMELDGFWLDAHSGAMPDDLFARSRDIVASLPNLGAIIFEIYPAFIESLEETLILNELEKVHELWAARGSHPAPRSTAEVVAVVEPRHGPTPQEWEQDLAAMVTGRHDEATADHGHGDDAGLALLQKLSLEFRSSMIVTNLPRTIRLLLLTVGSDVLQVFLDEYRRRNPPELFGASEALSFAHFLDDLDVGIPQFNGVLQFEIAALQTLLDGRDRVLRFDYDPFPMLRALAERRVSDELAQAGVYEVEITGQGPNDGGPIDGDPINGDTGEPQVIIVDGLARAFAKAGMSDLVPS